MDVSALCANCLSPMATKGPRSQGPALKICTLRKGFGGVRGRSHMTSSPRGEGVSK